MPQSSPIIWILIIFILISTFFITANSINTTSSSHEEINSNTHSFSNKKGIW